MGRVLRGVRIAAVFVCATSAFAVTRTVTNLNDSGTGSLRAQLAAAANGDTINFSVTGTIGLTSGELLIDKNLTISGPGANLLTISRASGASAFRLCHVANGTGIGPTVTILGLTFANGSAPGSTTSGDGGAIENEYGTLTIYSCAFSNNVAGHFGGAINNFASDSTPGDASLALHSCTFDSNQAGSSGGALANACLGQLSEFNANAELVLDNC